MNIVFFEVQEFEEPIIKRSLANFEVKLLHEALDENNMKLAEDADVISVFIYSNLNGYILNNLGKLRLIATRSTGFDHIDVKTAINGGITVCNVPVYGDTTVAEHAFALLLSLSRLIPDSYERTRQGDFTCEGVRGFDLNGKVLGVLGTGRIGIKVIEIARGFKMEVIAYDRYPNTDLADALGFKYVGWQELLGQSDIVSLHLPLTDETFHFLNKETMAKMKAGAVIINTARGGLIDSQALTDALRDGYLGGAGLDVLEEEALIREEAQLLLDNVPRKRLATMLRSHILLRLKNVVITPHCAFNSKESLERLVQVTADNIKAFAAGKPQNVVNLKVH